MAQTQTGIDQKVIWRSGSDSYHTYRIPALVTTNVGTLLAFCEGRVNSESDTGDIDLLVKRSEDNGNTWSDSHTIWNDGGNTCGNPCPIVDRSTGVIWLLMTWNHGQDKESQIIAGESLDTRRVFVTCSEDDGRSWKPPVEITATTKQADWTWYATGPGAGIQIERGQYQGRLVAPCDHIERGTRHYYSHVIYSDDHGKTWQLGGSTPRHRVNECQVVERIDGRLMLNMRNYDRTRRERQVAISGDGGLNWEAQHHDTALIEPICQASIRRHAWPSEGRSGLLLFSNPASAEARCNMTIRSSVDDGENWPTAVVLWQGPSAYSDLGAMANGQIACLYERGDERPYETITLARLNAALLHVYFLLTAS